MWVSGISSLESVPSKNLDNSVKDLSLNNLAKHGQTTSFPSSHHQVQRTRLHPRSKGAVPWGKRQFGWMKLEKSHQAGDFLLIQRIFKRLQTFLGSYMNPDFLSINCQIFASRSPGGGSNLDLLLLQACQACQSSIFRGKLFVFQEG